RERGLIAAAQEAAEQVAVGGVSRAGSRQTAQEVEHAVHRDRMCAIRPARSRIVNFSRGHGMGIYLPHRGKMLVLPVGATGHLAPELPKEPGFVRLTDRHRPALIVPVDCDTTPFEQALPVTKILEVWYSLPYDNLGAALQDDPPRDPDWEPPGEIID